MASGRMADAQQNGMLSHLSFGVADLARSIAFYDAALGALGYTRIWTEEHAAGYGVANRPEELALFVRAGAAPAGPGFHLAFTAPSPRAVDAFHAACLRQGGRDLGAPGLRPQYGAGYYAAFATDPDGHKIEAVHAASATEVTV